MKDMVLNVRAAAKEMHLLMWPVTQSPKYSYKT